MCEFRFVELEQRDCAVRRFDIRAGRGTRLEVELVYQLAVRA
jgi:hypothetical protein